MLVTLHLVLGRWFCNIAKIRWHRKHLDFLLQVFGFGFVVCFVCFVFLNWAVSDREKQLF